MAQISVDGQVISDIELKTSARNHPYVRFEFVEYIGKGENQRAQYFHVCAFAENALGIVNAGIGKGNTCSKCPQHGSGTDQRPGFQRMEL